MVSTQMVKERGEKSEQGEPTNLEDRYSNICLGCGGRLDFWAYEALCHHCGLKATCDE